MSSFIMSPGVLIQEKDQSFYSNATSTITVNTAAIIGYAEKGPFEPTYISNYDEFVQVFGETLKQVPYLSIAAKKYFKNGSKLLVVRAGDDRDPELYPNAAQYSSTQYRVNPQTVPGTAGYQTFKYNDLVIPDGSFTPNTQYGFTVTGDYRGFSEVEIEKWHLTLSETFNADGIAGEVNVFPNAVLKIASETLKNNTNAHLKYDKSNSGSTSTFWLNGNLNLPANSTFGNQILGQFNTYKSSTSDDTININLSYQAHNLGTVDMIAGYDWNATPQDFVIQLGGNSYTVTISTTTTTSAEVAAAINNALQTADNSGTPENISDQIAAFMFKKDGKEYIGLKKLTNSVDQYQLLSGTILTTLGWTIGTYKDSEGLIGTYTLRSVDGSTEKNFSGVVFGSFLHRKNMKSFEDEFNIVITSPASGNWALSDIRTAIQAELDNAYDGSHTSDGLIDQFTNTSANIVSQYDASIPELKIMALANADNVFESFVRITEPITVASLISLLNGVNSPVDGEAEKSIGEGLITLRAAEKGSYGQKLVLRVETKQIYIDPSTTQDLYNIYIIYNGKQVKYYDNINWTDINDDKYIVKVLENDPYLRLEAEDEDGNSTLVKLPDGDYKLGTDELPQGVTSTDVQVVKYTIGTNGWTEDSNGIITSMTSDFSNAINKIYNSEVYAFDIIIAPGDASPATQGALQNIVDARKDAVALIDAAPFGLGLGIKSGQNHISEVTQACNNINSSYCAIYWAWAQDYDEINKQYVWLPASIYALEQLTYTDKTAFTWYAPAGLVRGKISALGIEYSPSKDDRDILYGMNVINPLVAFINQGIVIWGQKTAQRYASATDRLNVRRLLIYAEKLIATIARGFLFEPNDPTNWAKFARQVNAVLEPIRQNNGLYSYKVVCDETTNTADVINQNKMVGKIQLTPTKTIETIEVGFTINTLDNTVEIQEQ